MFFAKSNLLKTGIDKFLESVESRKRVSADDLAAELDVSARTIEDWAKILEKEGLVTTTYDATGNLYVTSTEKNKEQKEKVAGDLHDGVAKELDDIEKSIKGKEEVLRDEEKKLLSFEKVLEKDLDLIKDMDKEVEKLQERALEIKKSFNGVMGSKKKTVAETQQISVFVDEKVKIIQQIEGQIKKFEKRHKELSKHSELVKKLMAAIRGPEPDYDRKSKEIQLRISDVRNISAKISRKYKKIQKLFRKL